MHRLNNLLDFWSFLSLYFLGIFLFMFERGYWGWWWNRERPLPLFDLGKWDFDSCIVHLITVSSLPGCLPVTSGASNVTRLCLFGDCHFLQNVSHQFLAYWGSFGVPSADGGAVVHVRKAVGKVFETERIGTLGALVRGCPTTYGALMQGAQPVTWMIINVKWFNGEKMCIHKSFTRYHEAS